ncbi:MULTISPECIES: hypothetical protein [unclassified Streptomyces]|uniref:hypothetical protein n=1 Tax=unclassified Streptomyces TaxID=2593676 RepID=UPI0036884215
MRFSRSERVLMLASAAALTVGLTLGACTPASSGQVARSADSPSWEKGADAEETAAFMKIQVPQGATEVKGAVRVQPQENIYLLSFVTSEQAAEAITRDLRPDYPLAKRSRLSSSLSGDGFKHLGLTPPQELGSVRTTSACPPCVGDSRRRHIQGIEIHIGEVAGKRVRVYLAAY